MTDPTGTRTHHNRRSLIVLLAVTVLAFVNYAALLPVVPLWAASGGAGSVIVGATTGVMMAATVLAQVSMPLLFRLMRLRTMIMVGAILLGAPAPLYALSSDIVLIMGVTLVRGFGFGLVVVAGATLVADVAPPGQLARAASYYGAAAALPNLAALAGGVWVAQTWGFGIVFVVAGASSVVAALLAVVLPGRPRGTFSVTSLDDTRRIAPPIAVFVTTSASFGATTTFLPLSGPDAATAALALLATSVALVSGRLLAGVVSDRVGPGRMLLPAVALVILGCVGIAGSLTGPAWLLLLSAAVLGLGFGACQNDSFVLTIHRLGLDRTGTASTIWNIAYDGGMGLGAVAFGGVLGLLGHGEAFLALAATITVVTVVAALGGAQRQGPDPQPGAPS
ncbi:MFS transporter [Microlunatus sp. Y2014]|uniref:MFS transporter n=1 Tax=Microlunatus sp. Y2014 TaxID=3418488 RepID=UPI003DA732FD